jgi:hypothetical protein
MTLARITVAWGVVFALVHLYWAAGEPQLAAGLYIAFIAVLGLAGAAVAHRGHRRLALLGAAALLAGVAVGVGRWIADGSLNGDGAEGVVITAYFLLGGVLFARLGMPGRGRSSLSLDARST